MGSRDLVFAPDFSRYVGVPYVEGGRDVQRDGGLDCWGLVRLVYAEQYGVNLPAYEDAAGEDEAVERMAREREGWAQVETPRTGDLVLLRIKGREQHVGVVTRPGYMLHVSAVGRAGAAVECLDSGSWRRRVAGYFRHVGAGAAMPLELLATPHPLKTARVEGYMRAGMSLAELHQELQRQGGSNLPATAVISVDGNLVPRDCWDEFRPAPGSRIEYRALPGGDTQTQRTIGLIAIAIAAAYTGGAAAAYASTTLGWGAGAAAAAGAVGGLAAAWQGGRLLDAIAPVPKPKEYKPGTARSMQFLQGGPNVPTPYAPLPLVLGRVRFTPPAAAQSWLEADGDASYVHMQLLWSYGPAQLSDVTIKDMPVSSFEETELVHLNDGTENTADELADFERIYGETAHQNEVNVKLLAENGWVEQTLDAKVGRVSLVFSFPQGLRTLQTSGSKAGRVTACPFTAEVEYRRLDPETLEPIDSWGKAGSTFSQKTINLSTAFYNIDSDPQLEEVYRWARISVNSAGGIVVRYGDFTDDPSRAAAGGVLAALQNEHYGGPASWGIDDYGGYTPQYQPVHIPRLGAGERELYRVCVKGSSIHEVEDMRETGEGAGGVDGGDLEVVSGTRISIAGGTVTRPDATIKIGGSGQPYCKRKDAFAHTVNVNVPKKSVVAVRVRKTSTDEEEFDDGTEKRRLMDCYWLTLTGFSSKKSVRLAKPLLLTAARVKATDQFNGSTDGITGTVTSICQDWDAESEVWVERPTRNPASLVRYLYQGPFTAKPKTDDELDLQSFQEFHDWCKLHGITYDYLWTERASRDEMVRDVCAVARASPILRDGMISIIIDKPRDHVVQHFTPHNSHGFLGSRALPELPHAFRVKFHNWTRGYQPDERIVYRDGYSADNATIFEAIDARGISDPHQAFVFGRFHMEQLQLRPERYTLNTDWEGLRCMRGDLVRVTHDVPMWGLGSGRIKSRGEDGLGLVIDEPLPMKAGTQYTIRIRVPEPDTDEGESESETRTVLAVEDDGEYTEIFLDEPVSENVGEPGNLIMFGELESESVLLVVEKVRFTGNLGVTLTLVDYAPALFDSPSAPTPPFDSQITQQAPLNRTTIKFAPSPAAITSDETAMTKLADDSYQCNIRVAFDLHTDLPPNVTHIEGRIGHADDTSAHWGGTQVVPLAGRTLLFPDVQELDQYRMKFRYIDDRGNCGPWSVTYLETVGGKQGHPSTPTGFAWRVNGDRIRLSWNLNPEIDAKYYELRTSDAEVWGGPVAPIWVGRSSSYDIEPPAPGVALNIYLRAADDGWRYSLASAHLLIEITAPRVAPAAVATVDGQMVRFTLQAEEGAYDDGTRLPVEGIEVRETDSGWGTDTGILYRGSERSFLLDPPAAGATKTVYMRRFDVVRNYSPSARSASFTAAPVPAPNTLSVSFSTAGGEAQALIKWKADLPEFKRRGFRITWTGGGTTGDLVDALQHPMRADWIGERIVSIVQIDNNGQESTAATLSVALDLPGNITDEPQVAVVGTKYQLEFALAHPTSLPVAGLEVRATDSGWGTSGALHRGSAVCTIEPPATGTSTTVYARQFDSIGNYSEESLAVVLTSAEVPVISADDIEAFFQDSALTNATVTISWPAQDAQFGVSGYLYDYSDDDGETWSAAEEVLATMITRPANWLGERLHRVRVINGRRSVGEADPKTVEKLPPAPPINLTTVIDANLALVNWELPEPTTLSVLGVDLRMGKVGVNDEWETADRKNTASATSAAVQVLEAGDYLLMACTYDTDNRPSEIISAPISLSAPPGYVLFDRLDDDLSGGTLFNALREKAEGRGLKNGRQITLGIDTGETIEEHFDANSWESPQDQIDLGYEAFGHPGKATGYYERDFDFGQTIGAAQISVTDQILKVQGPGGTPPVIQYSMRTSLDGETWSDARLGKNQFLINLRRVRLRVTAVGGLAAIQALELKADARLHHDGGAVDVPSSGDGAVVNFKFEVLDKESLVVTPSSPGNTKAVDFLDALLEGTYVVVSEVLTATVVAHGLKPGVNVRLSPSTGGAVALTGVYTVASVPDPDTFTVAMECADTSGSLSLYPQGFVVRVYDANNDRVADTVDWLLTAYAQ